MTPGLGLAVVSGLAALAPASGGLESLRPRGLAAEAAADDDDAAAAFLADVVRVMRLRPGDLLLRPRARPSAAASSVRSATPPLATVAEPEAFVGAEGSAPNGTGGFRVGGGGRRDEEAEADAAADAAADVLAGAAAT